MSPEIQTLVTLVVSVCTYFWGHSVGKMAGIEAAVIFFEQQGVITYDEEEDEDEQ